MRAFLVLGFAVISGPRLLVVAMVCLAILFVHYVHQFLLDVPQLLPVLKEFAVFVPLRWTRSQSANYSLWARWWRRLAARAGTRFRVRALRQPKGLTNTLTTRRHGGSHW
jgi:hypothetical protein